MRIITGENPHKRPVCDCHSRSKSDIVSHQETYQKGVIQVSFVQVQVFSEL